MVLNVLMLVAKTVKLVANPSEMAEKVLDATMNGFDVAEQIYNAAEAFNFPICKNYDNVLKTLPKYWSDDRWTRQIGKLSKYVQVDHTRALCLAISLSQTLKIIFSLKI